MKAALAIVIVVGAGVGLLFPAERQDSAAQKRAPQMPVAAAPATSRVQPARPWHSETRLTAGPGGHFRATALVNGQPVGVIVDTGATTVALSVADARRIGIAVDPATFTEVGMGAGGPVRGQHVTIDSISIDSREVRALRGVVLEGLEESLLGQSYLSQIGEVTMNGGAMILR